jgi:hypothetical protein
VRLLHHLQLAALLLLGGCSTQNNIWGQYLQVLRESWRNSTGSGTVSMEQAAGVPYASLAYRVDGSSEAMLVLATDSNGDLLWTAASRVVLMTRDGRVLRSVGFAHDRGGMTSESARVPAPALALQKPYRSVRLADFPDAELYGVRLTCVTTSRGPEMVTILGTALATRRVEETCQSRSPRWSFTDHYWVDASSGFVWQSQQHLHPRGPTLQIKILRPPE